MVYPFSKEITQTLIFEFKEIWKISYREGYFDRYDYDSHIERLIDDQPHLKAALKKYLSLLKLFHFIDHYIFDSLEDTLLQSEKILKEHKIDEVIISWFNELNVSVIYEETYKIIPPTTEINKSTEIKKDIIEKVNSINNQEDSLRLEYEKSLNINSAEDVNTWGLIPLYLITLLFVIGYFTHIGNLNPLVGQVILGIYLLVSIGFFFLISDTTNYLKIRPWLTLYGAYLILFSVLALIITFNWFGLYQSEVIKTLFFTRFVTSFINVIIIIYGLFILINLSFFYLFRDPMMDGYIYAFINTFMFVIVSVLAYFTEMGTFYFMFYLIFSLSTLLHFSGSLYVNQRRNTFLGFLNLTLIIITWFFVY